MKFLLKPFALVAALFAVTPAFASSCGPRLAEIGMLAWACNQIEWLAFHTSMLWTGIQMGNLGLILEAFDCANERVLSMFLLTPWGWAMMIAAAFVFANKRALILRYILQAVTASTPRERRAIKIKRTPR
jgi:hypothetical protein